MLFRSWMIDHVPEDLKYLPKLAMKIWFEGEKHLLPEEDLSRLRDYLVNEIKEVQKDNPKD